jgi:HSP20 family protein
MSEDNDDERHDDLPEEENEGSAAEENEDVPAEQPEEEPSGEEDVRHIDVKKDASVETKKSHELAIRRHNPVSLFQDFDRAFNNMANESDRAFWSPTGLNALSPFRFLGEGPFFRTPLANITEDESSFTITAEMPGLEKGDIEITLHDGVLEIKGEKKERVEKKEKYFVRKEYSSSQYHRVFSLPETADQEAAIDANLEHGVLKVRIPKKEPETVQKKKIEVK